MLIYLRSTDLMPDPRIEKYINWNEEKSISYKLVGWNRGNKKILKSNTIYFDKRSAYSSGYKNIFSLVLWNYFLLKTLIKQNNTFQVIHACDFDTVLPALIVKILFKKKVIFDIFDWYTDSRPIKNRFILLILWYLEKLALKKADYIILCEEEREKQLPIRLSSKKIAVLPNIPAFKTEYFENIISNNILKLSYVGVLTRDRGLEDLLSVVSCFENLEIKIAGFGELEDMVSNYSSQFKNIIFLGKVNYEHGLAIMADSNIICGMYYKTNKNHLYAAPNKYYESLVLGRPLLTTSGTLVGEKTLKGSSGFVIDEGTKPIHLFFSNINLKFISEYGFNGRQLFLNEYSNKTRLFFENKYQKMISS